MKNYVNAHNIRGWIISAGLVLVLGMANLQAQVKVKPDKPAKPDKADKALSNIAEAELPAAVIESLKKAAPQCVIESAAKATNGNRERYRVRFYCNDKDGTANFQLNQTKIAGEVELEISVQDIPAVVLEAFRKQKPNGNISKPAKQTEINGEVFTVNYLWRTGGYSGWEIDPDAKKIDDKSERVKVSADGSKVEIQQPGPAGSKSAKINELR